MIIATYIDLKNNSTVEILENLLEWMKNDGN